VSKSADRGYRSADRAAQHKLLILLSGGIGMIAGELLESGENLMLNFLSGYATIPSQRAGRSLCIAQFPILSPAKIKAGSN
jgi:hypothetical protein